jgi:hypothetical protein
MFRKMILTVAVGAGLVGAAEFTPADAAWGHHYRPIIVRPVIVAPRVICEPVCSYNLYYRTCAANPWVLYRSYGEERFAIEAQARLQVGGFQVMIGR